MLLQYPKIAEPFYIVPASHSCRHGVPFPCTRQGRLLSSILLRAPGQVWEGAQTRGLGKLFIASCQNQKGQALREAVRREADDNCPIMHYLHEGRKSRQRENSNVVGDRLCNVLSFHRSTPFTLPPVWIVPNGASFLPAARSFVFSLAQVLGPDDLQQSFRSRNPPSSIDRGKLEVPQHLCSRTAPRSACGKLLTVLTRA